MYNDTNNKRNSIFFSTLFIKHDSKPDLSVYFDDLCDAFSSYKLHQRLYFLRKLRSFNVDKSIMVTFYSSTVESIFVFGIVCYGGNISKYQILKINRTIKRAGKIINQQLPLFEDLYTTSAVKKAKEIIEDTSHILNKEYETSDRSGRLLSKRSRTNRYKNSFVPVTTRLLQSSL